jgi:hypothetical protein
MSSLVAKSHQSLPNPPEHDLQGLDELFSHTRVAVDPVGDDVLLLGKGDRSGSTSTASPGANVRRHARIGMDSKGGCLASTVASETTVLAREYPERHSP